MAAQGASHVALRQEVDEDNLEVVGLDYLVKSEHSRQKGNRGVLNPNSKYVFNDQANTLLNTL